MLSFTMLQRVIRRIIASSSLADIAYFRKSYELACVKNTPPKKTQMLL